MTMYLKVLVGRSSAENTLRKSSRESIHGNSMTIANSAAKETEITLPRNTLMTKDQGKIKLGAFIKLKKH